VTEFPQKDVASLISKQRWFLFERGLDGCKCGFQFGTHTSYDWDENNGNPSGNQSVFNRGSCRFVPKKANQFLLHGDSPRRIEPYAHKICLNSSSSSVGSERIIVPSRQNLYNVCACSAKLRNHLALDPLADSRFDQAAIVKIARLVNRTPTSPSLRQTTSHVRRA
jgi:hypothetical protein